MRRRAIPGEPEPPSKGELKRRAHSVQELADRLIAVPESTLDGLDLPEALRDAVLLARRINGGSALVRQKQYVAKLMRRIDVEPLRAALEPRRARGGGRASCPARALSRAVRGPGGRLTRSGGRRRDGERPRARICGCNRWLA